MVSAFFQVRLEWPTDLAVNPMDNSLYVLENNVILRITENHQVGVQKALSAQAVPLQSVGQSGNEREGWLAAHHRGF